MNRITILLLFIPIYCFGESKLFYSNQFQSKNGGSFIISRDPEIQFYERSEIDSSGQIVYKKSRVNNFEIENFRNYAKISVYGNLYNVEQTWSMINGSYSLSKIRIFKNQIYHKENTGFEDESYGSVMIPESKKCTSSPFDSISVALTKIIPLSDSCTKFPGTDRMKDIEKIISNEGSIICLKNYGIKMADVIIKSLKGDDLPILECSNTRNECQNNMIKGLYDKKKDKITLCQSCFDSKDRGADTLLHEALHKYTRTYQFDLSKIGAEDNTACLEDPKNSAAIEEEMHDITSCCLTKNNAACKKLESLKKEIESLKQKHEDSKIPYQIEQIEGSRPLSLHENLYFYTFVTNFDQKSIDKNKPPESLCEDIQKNDKFKNILKNCSIESECVSSGKTTIMSSNNQTINKAELSQNTRLPEPTFAPEKSVPTTEAIKAAYSKFESITSGVTSGFFSGGSSASAKPGVYYPDPSKPIVFKSDKSTSGGILTAFSKAVIPSAVASASPMIGGTTLQQQIPKSQPNVQTDGNLTGIVSKSVSPKAARTVDQGASSSPQQNLGSISGLNPSTNSTTEPKKVILQSQSLIDSINVEIANLKEASDSKSFGLTEVSKIVKKHENEIQKSSVQIIVDSKTKPIGSEKSSTKYIWNDKLGKFEIKK